MFQQCTKETGLEDIPSKPRKGCAFALKKVEWQFVDDAVLDAARLPRNNEDASVVTGTLSHYNFRFISVGKLQMRWLSCPCSNCLSKCWDSCTNKAWVGEFEEVEQQQIGNHGYGARDTEQKRLTNEMASAIKVGSTAAIYTSIDPQCHTYWLVKVSKLPWIVEGPGECATSGDKFEEGDQIFDVTYFDRQGAQEGGDRIYRHKEGLGVFRHCLHFTFTVHQCRIA